MITKAVPVVILAAGLGKRLQPLTLTTPKPMLPILGKPILEYVLSSVRKAGFSNVILVVDPQNEKIKSHFKDGSRSGLCIHYAFQDQPLGMAHATSAARDLVKADTLFLMASDNIVEAESLLSMVEKHLKGGFSGTLSLMKARQEDVSNLSSVKIDRRLRVEKIVEKPKPEEAPSNIVSMPIYVFNKAIFRFLRKVGLSPRGEYEIQDAIQMMIDKRLVVSGFLINHRLHLTTIEDLMDINWYFLERESRMVESRDFDTFFPAMLHPTCRVGAGSEIGPYVYIGAGSRLGRNVKIIKSILMSGVKVGKGSTIANCVLGNDVQIGSRCQLGDVAGDPAVIGDHSNVKRNSDVPSGTRLNTGLY